MSSTDGFQIVSRKKSKKVEKSSNNSIIKPLEINIKTVVGRLLFIQEEIFNSDFYTRIKLSLKKTLTCLHNPLISTIVCFGLGNIGESIISRYQFALLQCLKVLFKATVYAYDPVFTEDDHKILKEFDVNLLKDNVEGKYKIDSYTIFYMPHCPKQLTNNLIWSNWGLNLSKCIILANSFNRIIDSNSSHTIKESAEYIIKILPYVEEFPIVNSFKYLDIFNDTSIHIFLEEKLNLIDKFLWEHPMEPKYSTDDIEFITIKLSNI